MEKINKTVGGSIFTKTLPLGCKKCLVGEKMVIFVTGICKDNCFYCPVSFRRRNKDVAYANERVVRDTADLILEAKRQKATGASITGGDPLLKVDRTVRYVRALKKAFGKKFHIHLYTSGTAATPKKMENLYKAGVDEIRFHRNLEAVRMARKFGWKVGAEIPAMPGRLKVIKNFLKGLEEAGAEFCNINELEVSEGNAAAFAKKDFRTVHRFSPAVRNSEEVALKLVLWGMRHLRMPLHYCPCYIKDGVQLRKRFLRTAKNVRKPYQQVDVDGLLVFGAVAGSEKDRKRIIGELKIGPRMVEEAGRGKLYTSVKIAERLSKKGYRCWIEKRYPTADDTLIELEPI